MERAFSGSVYLSSNVTTSTLLFIVMTSNHALDRGIAVKKHLSALLTRGNDLPGWPVDSGDAAISDALE